jgi:hypothetical protein
MNLTLWIVASILSLLTLASGAVKVAKPRPALIEGGYGWAEDFSDSAVKSIGLLEVAAAVGLVLPGVVDVADDLVPAAAAGLAILMAAAALTHVRRGELKHTSMPIVLASVAAFVAIMRLGPYGF